MKKDNVGVTILEIIMMVTLLGLLASFAIPNYARAIEKADEKVAVANLKAIQTGVQFYLGNTGNANIPNWGSLNAINAGLGLGLSDNKFTYSCVGSFGGEQNYCTATHPSGWIVHFHAEYDPIHCSGLGGPCPTCLTIPGGGTTGCGV